MVFLRGKNRIFYIRFKFVFGQIKTENKLFFSLHEALNIEDSLKKVIDTFFPTVTSHQGQFQLTFHRQEENNLVREEIF